MNLAPIALFVYNRPEHTKKTIAHLVQCDFARDSELFIFADGPKPGCTQEVVEKIDAVRKVIKNVAGFYKTNVILRDENIGLARSIITGVTELCQKYGRVIVLEDDLIVNIFFLRYMNGALEKYKENVNVYQISGFMFPINLENKNVPFFLPLSTTWGWATWRRAWDICDWNPVGVYEKLANRKFSKKFDLDGAYSYSQLIKERLIGKNDSWGILYWWAVFNVNGMVLYPAKTLVKNVGFDGTGTHCKKIEDTLIQSNHKWPENFALEFPEDVRPDLKIFQLVKRHLHKKPKICQINWYKIKHFLVGVLERIKRI